MFTSWSIYFRPTSLNELDIFVADAEVAPNSTSKVWEASLHDLGEGVSDMRVPASAPYNEGMTSPCHKYTTLNLYQVHPDLPFEFIDQVVKAELPTDNPSLREKVKKYMTHNKDHLQHEISCCKKGNKCIYGFPHPITPQMWVEEDGRIHF